MQNRKLLNIELGRVSAEEYRELPESGLVVVLDNIRSAHNVGSAFRTSDSFKIDKVWLCGICAVPPSAEIHKSALGAEDSVAWEHVRDTMDAIRRLKEDGYTIISADQTAQSVMLNEFTPEKIGENTIREIKDKKPKFSFTTFAITVAVSVILSTLSGAGGAFIKSFVNKGSDKK